MAVSANYTELYPIFKSISKRGKNKPYPVLFKKKDIFLLQSDLHVIPHVFSIFILTCEPMKAQRVSPKAVVAECKPFVKIQKQTKNHNYLQLHALVAVRLCKLEGVGFFFFFFGFFLIHVCT